MKPVRPDAEPESGNDDLQPADKRHPSANSGLSSASDSVGNLQRKYADQLNNEIQQLETERAELQGQISKLRQEYAQLKTQIKDQQPEAQRQSSEVFSDESSEETYTGNLPSTADNAYSDSLSSETLSSTDKITLSGPILPGEKEAPPSSLTISAALKHSKENTKERPLELPTPATSERQRQLVMQRQRRIEPVIKANARKSVIRGFTLSAIATLVTAWHYGLINTLHEGGSWLGADIGQITLGFVPSVALLWLRMLIMVPAIVFLAPKLHPSTWEDLQDWFYHDDKRFLPLVGSGVALFFSQAFLYQSIGSTGAIVGSALLFLYPLTTTPLELVSGNQRSLTPFGLLSLVAIAMGGLLVAKPALSIATPTGILLGLLASFALSLYITLTNLSYRQQCHPIPTAVIQFSTVAVLSSLVLLVKPLTMVNISWLGFCLWGILIGILMLIAYFFTYSSLRLISGKTAVIAALTPLAVLLLRWSFSPQPTLAIIQWTGILLISLGGIAISKEKLAK